MVYLRRTGDLFSQPVRIGKPESLISGNAFRKWMRKYMDVLVGALITLKPQKGRAGTTGRINPFRLFGL